MQSVCYRLIYDTGSMNSIASSHLGGFESASYSPSAIASVRSSPW